MDSMKWEYRTVLHKEEDGGSYLTVHEFYIEGGKYKGYSAEPASPMCGQEIEWMAKAFERNPVVEVDDSTCWRDEYGFAHYSSWSWLEKKAV